MFIQFINDKPVVVWTFMESQREFKELVFMPQSLRKRLWLMFIYIYHPYSNFFVLANKSDKKGLELWHETILWARGNSDSQEGPDWDDLKTWLSKNGTDRRLKAAEALFKDGKVLRQSNADVFAYATLARLEIKLLKALNKVEFDPSESMLVDQSENGDEILRDGIDAAYITEAAKAVTETLKAFTAARSTCEPLRVSLTKGVSDAKGTEANMPLNLESFGDDDD